MVLRNAAPPRPSPPAPPPPKGNNFNRVWSVASPNNAAPLYYTQQAMLKAGVDLYFGAAGFFWGGGEGLKKKAKDARPGRLYSSCAQEERTPCLASGCQGAPPPARGCTAPLSPQRSTPSARGPPRPPDVHTIEAEQCAFLFWPGYGVKDSWNAQLQNITVCGGGGHCGKGWRPG
jgi:hypothetical protein